MNVFRYTRRHFKVRGWNDFMPRVARTKRAGLATMLCDLELNRGVEVGVREGLHSLLLCQRNPNIELTCIDPWAPYGRWTEDKQRMFFDMATERMAPYNATLLRKTSMDALADFEDESLDFAHIDGNHEFDYAMEDIIGWSKKVRSGGVVSVHDYFHFKLNGVIYAVNAYTHCHMINPWFVTNEKLPTAFWEKP